MALPSPQFLTFRNAFTYREGVSRDGCKPQQHQNCRAGHPQCGPLRSGPVNSRTLSLLVVHIQKQKGTGELARIPEQNRAQLEVGPAQNRIWGLTAWAPQGGPRDGEALGSASSDHMVAARLKGQSSSLSRTHDDDSVPENRISSQWWKGGSATGPSCPDMQVRQGEF